MNVLTECLSQGTSPASVISFAKEYLKQEEKQYETICRRLERENTRKAVERLEEVRLLLEQNREAQR